ncbi:MAG: hypothetical protein QXO12_02705 [Candidatus Pacearchaeota archaeon]
MIKEKFEELKKQDIFIKEKNKGYLFLVFLITDANLNIEQIDFSFLKNNISTSFSFRNNCWIKIKNKEERNFKKINLDVDIEKIYKKISSMLIDRNLFVNKYIFIFQNLDGKQIINVTCLCKDFYVLKIVFDSKDFSLIEEKIYNLLDFFKVG